MVKTSYCHFCLGFYLSALFSGITVRIFHEFSSCVEFFIKTSILQTMLVPDQEFVKNVSVVEGKETEAN